MKTAEEIAHEIEGVWTGHTDSLVLRRSISAIIAREIVAAEARGIESAMSKLQNPAVVHMALLRGRIARPTVTQIAHIYGAKALKGVLNDAIERGEDG